MIFFSISFFLIIILRNDRIAACNNSWARAITYVRYDTVRIKTPNTNLSTTQELISQGGKGHGTGIIQSYEHVHLELL